MAQPGRRRPLSLVLLAIILLVFAGAAATIYFGGLRPAGSIPRRATVLSLAFLSTGFIAGTSDGAFKAPPHGRSWERYELAKGPVVVASGSEFRTSTSRFTLRTVAASGQTFFIFDDSVEAHAGSPAEFAALAVGPFRYVGATGVGALYFRGRFRDWESLTGRGPDQIQAMAIPQSDENFLVAGGIQSGLWRSGPLASPLKWTRLLQTPVTAVLIDPDDSNRLLLGTPGGILVSTNRGDSWRFADFRGPVSGLTTDGSDFFAISNRLLYRSPDGEKDWVPLATEN